MALAIMANFDSSVATANRPLIKPNLYLVCHVLKGVCVSQLE